MYQTLVEEVANPQLSRSVKLKSRKQHLRRGWRPLYLCAKVTHLNEKSKQSLEAPTHPRPRESRTSI